MRHLIRLVAARYARAMPLRSLLTLLGISLGVSVVFATDVVSRSVMRSFETTVNEVAGQTSLIVGGDGAGVAEELLETVRGVEGVAVAAPLIQDDVRRVEGGRSFAVLAIDLLADSGVRDYDIATGDVAIPDEVLFLNDPHAVIITESYARESGLGVGDTLRLQTSSGTSDFTVRGTMSAQGPARVFGGNLLLMDVFASQIAFGRGRRFDQIDVVAAPGVEVEALRARLSTALGDGITVQRPERRTQEAEKMLGGFRIGLLLGALVAVVVGAFVVYNALAIAVAQRRREVGVLMALGATPGQVQWMFLLEGLLMGLLGSALGIAGGVGLGNLVLEAVGSTISALYFRVRPEHLAVGALQVALGVLCGVCASLAAAFFPARSAATTDVAIALKRSREGDSAMLSPAGRAPLWVACLALLAALGVATYAHIRESFMVGLGVSALLSVAAACACPWLARSVGGLARRVGSRGGVSWQLGSAGFDRNAGRNAVAIAALGIALANVVMVAGFLGSMKENMRTWLDRVIGADIAVLGGSVGVTSERSMSAELGKELSQLEGVELVSGYRMVRQSYDDQPFFLVSYDFGGFVDHSEMPVVAGDLQRARETIEAGEAVAATQTFARQHGVVVGDTVRLSTPTGTQPFRIDLIYADYTSESGILTTSTDVYRRVWRDSRVDTYNVYLAPSADREGIQRAIVRRWGEPGGLLVLQNAEYKGALMEMIDQTFVVTRALQIVAIIVAVLGIINTLFVTVLDRRRELGTLAALGADPRQIGAVVGIEAALLGLTAGLLGIALGSAFSVYLVVELLRMHYGWEMEWVFSWTPLIEALVAAQIAAWLGSRWPVRAATQQDPVESLAYD